MSDAVERALNAHRDFRYYFIPSYRRERANADLRIRLR